jgi:glycine hydroxymethyltransferase
MELNYNSIPFDPRKPFDPSGIRIGVAALTSRGLAASDMAQVGALIHDGIELAVAGAGTPEDAAADRLRARVREFLAPFPAPGL